MVYFLPVVYRSYASILSFVESASIAFDWSWHSHFLPYAHFRAEALRLWRYPLLRKEHITLMKNKKMSIRINDTELERIHRKAEQAKLSLTDYVTSCCLGKQIIVVDGLNEVIQQQKAIGRNLNQLTMLCNMGRVEIGNLAEMIQQYADTNRYFAELLDRKRWSDGNG